MLSADFQMASTSNCWRFPEESSKSLELTCVSSLAICSFLAPVGLYLNDPDPTPQILSQARLSADFWLPSPTANPSKLTHASLTFYHEDVCIFLSDPAGKPGVRSMVAQFATTASGANWAKCNKCMLCHSVAKFQLAYVAPTGGSNLQLIQFQSKR